MVLALLLTGCVTLSPCRPLGHVSPSVLWEHPPPCLPHRAVVRNDEMMYVKHFVTCKALCTCVGDSSLMVVLVSRWEWAAGDICREWVGCQGEGPGCD